MTNKDLTKVIMVAGVFLEKHLEDVHGFQQDDAVKIVAAMSSAVKMSFADLDKKIEGLSTKLEKDLKKVNVVK